MHWGTSRFVELHDALQNAALLSNIEMNESIASHVRQLISNIKEDLTEFLNTPDKNQSSREKLRKGIVDYENEQFKVNQDFIDASCMLADEVDLDELACSQILFESADESSRLGINPIQGGVSVFHVRRQYILDIVKFLICESNTETASNDWLCKIANETINDISSKESIPMKALNAMNKVEQVLGAINEKHKRGELLGDSTNDEFAYLIKLRKDFTIQEHDVLGQILYFSAENLDFDEPEITKYLELAKNVSNYNTLHLHYIPALLILPLIQTCSSAPRRRTILEQKFDLLNNASETWKLPFWGHALRIVFGCYLIGELPGQSKKILPKGGKQQEEERLKQIEKAIDQGGMEFLMALAADNSPKAKSDLFEFQNYRTLLTFRVPEFQSIDQLSPQFQQILLNELRRLAHNIIFNLGIMLKDMRTNEEDIYMSQNRFDKDQMSDDGTEEDQPGVDYERFLIMIGSLYAGNEDSALEFWEDNGDLVSFTEWIASSSPSSIMLSASSALLTSLSCGPHCSQYGQELLTLGGSHNRKTVQINWVGMVTRIYECYASVFGLTQKQDQTRALQEYGGIDGDSLLVLCSYFQLMNELAMYDSNARTFLFDASVGPSGNTEMFLIIMIQLLRVESVLYRPIMRLLSTLFRPVNHDIRVVTWNVVDEWLLDSDIYASDTSVIPNISIIPIPERISSIFRSYAELEELILMLTSMLGTPQLRKDHKGYLLPFDANLGATYRYPGIWPYTQMVIDYVFSHYSITENDLISGLKLKLACLKFISAGLKLFDRNSSYLTPSKMAFNTDLISNFDEFNVYLKSHPFAHVMSSLFDSENYTTLFNCAKIGIDDIVNRSYDDEIIQVLIRSLGIIKTVLDSQYIYLDIAVKESKNDDKTPFSVHGLRNFEDALLYNLTVIPYFMLYAGSSNPVLALLSIQILQFISLSPQFIGTSRFTRDGRINEDRLLSTVMTVDESYRIRKEFINQLEREFDRYEDVPASFYFGETKKSIYDEMEDPIKVKTSLLNFLISNLEREKTGPTVAHFLLGFRIGGDGTLAIDTHSTGIGSGSSLLQSIVDLLKNGIERVTSKYVSYESSLMLSACSRIILLLCSRPDSSSLVLELLRGWDFFQTTLISEPAMLRTARWSELSYTEENKEEFFESWPASTLTAFYQHRAAITECAAIEIYHSMKQGALSLIDKYNDILISSYTQKSSSSFGTRPVKLLSLLDFLEFVDPDSPILDDQLRDFIGPKAVEFYENYEKNEIINDDGEVARSEFEQLLWLRGNELIISKEINSDQQAEWIRAKRQSLALFIRMRAKKRQENVFCQCLESWCKLLLVVVNENRLSPERRSALILEVFQSISPKLLEYSQFSHRLCSPLTSLLVSLSHVFYKDDSKDNIGGSFNRTHMLFKVSLSVLQMKITSSVMRTDLYMIGYLQLKNCLEISREQPEVLNNTVNALRLSRDRILNIACSDASSGESQVQLASIMFLEMASAVALQAKSSFVLDGLVKYNLLSLLISSVVTIGQTLTEEDDDTNNHRHLKESYDVLSQILCFVLQLSQTRTGATQVIQAGIFDAIRQSGVLKIDPDTSFVEKIRIDEQTEGLSNYSLVSLIFQIVLSSLLSMGPDNQKAMQRTQNFLDENQRFVVTVLRNDSSRQNKQEKGSQLVKSLVLLLTLANH